MELRESHEPAIKIQEAFKSYNGQYILKGLNMTVPFASIYALLGPSGCGKTTLLKCIVGSITLDSGQISLKNKYISEIGFMPQNTALYSLLKIRETFQYYGQIFGMSREQVKTRTREMTEILELPNENRIVESLSGGQQRRVSMAVALLHNPKILILDEPTVGLDPLLSQSIWKHLLELSSQENRTVIITTHYIEEAKQAHMVGLMRDGILLCEDSPVQIMASQNCDSMEHAFLQLSYIQQNNRMYCGEELREPPPIDKSAQKKKKKLLKKVSVFSLSCLLAEIIKNLVFYSREKLTLGFMITLPIMISLIFILTIGHPPKNLKLGIVNNEIDMEDCLLEAIGCNETHPISCRYLNLFKEQQIILVEFESLILAKEAVLRNEVWGVVEVPSNFSISLLERIKLNLHTSDTALETGQLDVWLDMSNYAIGNLLKYDVFKTFKVFLSDFLSDCGWPPETIEVPIKFQKPIFGKGNINYNQSATPAVVMLIIFYLPMISTIGAVMQEKVTGVLDRSISAGVTMIEVYSSHLIIQFFVIIIQMFMLILVLYYANNNLIVGNPLFICILAVEQGLCGQALGFLLAIFFNRTSHASITGVGCCFVYIFLSGLAWPQEGLYLLPQWVRWLSPVAVPTESLRGITERGWGGTHPGVTKGYFSIAVWIVIFSSMTHFCLRTKKGTL